MRFARNRSEVSQACFRAPDGRPEHSVEPNAGGWFDVTSARSGQVYRVSTSGECSCPGFGYAGRCSHLACVLEFAEELRRSRPDLF